MVLYQWTHWAVAISRSSMEFQGPLVSDQFGFIQRVECLGERVVVGADRGDGVAVGKGLARNGSRCTGRPDPNGE